ncbi:MAG: flagellar basal body rod protein FlgB [Terriglobia bacterium]
MSKVFCEDGSMQLMERYLDLSVKRQSLIASNLANVDTPGYKTVDLDFKQELEAAHQVLMDKPQTTNRRHIDLKIDKEGSSSVAPQEVDGLTSRNDLNNVNVDREMTQLSTNALKFSMVAQLLAGKFRVIKNAINEGR